MSFLAVTAHWIGDEWVQQDITLGFEHIKGPHTGEALTEAFITVVKRFNLQRKATLGKSGLGAAAPVDAESLDVEDGDDDSEGLVRTSIVEEESDSDAEESEGHDPPETVASIAEALNDNVDNNNLTKRALFKLRKGIVKISLPALGSTYVMMDRGLQCKAEYCTVLIENNLDEFVLKEVEWRQITSLRDLLQQFGTLTTKVCASKTYVTITLTVVVYNRIMNVLDDFRTENSDRLPDICRGAEAAYEKLRKYYSATDSSPMYSVATAVHPAMRFRYWSDQQWGLDYERTAKESVRTVWRDTYTDGATDSDDDEVTVRKDRQR
ncbi:hypothetical protein BGZ67_010561 [Mortierella alpina]|nr:hypothetical protein BGZ67_010561 [Mortierella alpina]